ncbi:adenosylcobinamide-phosphate synthase CbiB [Marinobacter sp. HL-58]|uniref:adenosylcobinamide-phosphate synthase CbiB n=1 Tax=Marinobacter sp. HL-58 TaxID=1479237 RepID=UPI000486297C|nr:adenosylcobinamide-phosphate synthase CbiB [Marinobacter sp. HL-58]KPP96987.1 MAG: adenosylcobinamide-phosphate synthase CbiB [Marinobacter sp. HL-58]
MNVFILSVFICLAAVLLDRWLGEPRRWHPLVGFGHLVTWVEKRLNRLPQRKSRSILSGLLGLLLVVSPVLLVAELLRWLLADWGYLMLQVLVLYLALSIRGLTEHGRAVSEALHRGDLEGAREQVGRIVSRKASDLNEHGVAGAASESMLENGADAVFASLFWFLVAGIPGVLLHRLVNTLDAMWGYRSERYLYFGRIAARLDDALNWVPARLTALTYGLLGHRQLAWQCWRTQAPQWDSPNAGPVMAAGAGALGVSLGGPAPYASGIRQRPVLGQGPVASAETIDAAIGLVQRGVWLWLGVLGLIAAIAVIARGGFL